MKWSYLSLRQTLENQDVDKSMRNGHMNPSLCDSCLAAPSQCQHVSVVLSKHRTEALICGQWQSGMTISLQWPETKLSLIYPFKHNADMPST